MSTIILNEQNACHTSQPTIQKNTIFSSIEEIIQDIKQGKMFILVDDEERENEGDFIVCADLVTKQQIAQMILHGSGIVYLVIDQQKQQQLQLQRLRKTGKAAQDELHVAFLEPIEAANNIETGISASDRHTTIKSAINPNAKPSDIITPGHVLTILAHPMGLRIRQGHTEASNTLMKLAGFEGGYAVGCEVINPENGEMARLPQLIKIAQSLDLKICAVKDLLKYLNLI